MSLTVGLYIISYGPHLEIPRIFAAEEQRQVKQSPKGSGMRSFSIDKRLDG